jgi:hypothetical protein
MILFSRSGIRSQIEQYSIRSETTGIFRRRHGAARDKKGVRCASAASALRFVVGQLKKPFCMLRAGESQ